MVQSWSASRDETAAVSDETRLEVFIEDVTFRHLGEKLPRNVFFMNATIGAAHTAEEGDVVEGLAPPEYPWAARMPPAQPTVSRRSVYFQNPLESTPSGRSPWAFSAFVEKHEEGVETLKESGHKSVADRIYAYDLTLCEIPPEYVTESNAGRRTPDINAMHKDTAEVTIGTFGPRSQGIANQEVAEKIGRVLPGGTSKPRQLKEIRRVHITDPEDAHRDRRYAYYTEQDHENGKCEYRRAPETITVADADLEDKSGHTGGDAVRFFFPELGTAIGGYGGTEGDGDKTGPKFLAACRFDGHTEQGEEFVEDGVELL